MSTFSLHKSSMANDQIFRSRLGKSEIVVERENYVKNANNSSGSYKRSTNNLSVNSVPNHTTKAYKSPAEKSVYVDNHTAKTYKSPAEKSVYVDKLSRCNSMEDREHYLNTYVDHVRHCMGEKLCKIADQNQLDGGYEASELDHDESRFVVESVNRNADCNTSDLGTESTSSVVSSPDFIVTFDWSSLTFEDFDFSSNDEKNSEIDSIDEVCYFDKDEVDSVGGSSTSGIFENCKQKFRNSKRKIRISKPHFVEKLTNREGKIVNSCDKNISSNPKDNTDKDRSSNNVEVCSVVSDKEQESAIDLKKNGGKLGLRRRRSLGFVPQSIKSARSKVKVKASGMKVGTKIRREGKGGAKV